MPTDALTNASTTAVSMTEEEYRAMPGLSNSSMKLLAISPYQYWYREINPDRPPRETTPFLEFGHALHCAVLEPAEFDKRYCCLLDKEDFPGALDTVSDMKEWMEARSLGKNFKRKDEFINYIHAFDRTVPILQVLEEEYESLHDGKLGFKKDDWARINGAAAALRAEPALMRILDAPGGQHEVAMSVIDPETGVRLKSRMDFINPSATVDLKTFTQKRGMPIDKTITNAIYYEQYYHQAYFYSHVRSLAGGGNAWSGAQNGQGFVLAFVESDPPHEVRLRSLLPRIGRGEPNLYWSNSRLHVRGLIQLYADCMAEFGDKPWRTDREIEPLQDEEIPQLAY